MRDDDLADMPEELRARFVGERDRFQALGDAAHCRYKVDQLPGMTTQEARRVVEAEGGYFEPLPADDPGVVVTLDIRLDRVRAWVLDGRVKSAGIG